MHKIILEVKHLRAPKPGNVESDVFAALVFYSLDVGPHGFAHPAPEQNLAN